jgi:hypothetical protein
MIHIFMLKKIKIAKNSLFPFLSRFINPHPINPSLFFFTLNEIRGLNFFSSIPCFIFTLLYCFGKNIISCAICLLSFAPSGICYPWMEKQQNTFHSYSLIWNFWYRSVVKKLEFIKRKKKILSFGKINKRDTNYIFLA